MTLWRSSDASYTVPTDVAPHLDFVGTKIYLEIRFNFFFQGGVSRFPKLTGKKFNIDKNKGVKHCT
jgi:hypothetical protein